MARCRWCGGSKAHRTRSGCAGAATLRAIPTARKRLIASEGGKTNAICRRVDVLARYVGLSWSEAVWRAWTDALRVSKHRRHRAKSSLSDALGEG